MLSLLPSSTGEVRWRILAARQHTAEASTRDIVHSGIGQKGKHNELSP